MHVDVGDSIFDGERAKQYARTIAFPRLVGTEGEARAGETIVRILTELGYRVRQEKFSIRVPPWVWMKGFLIISFSLFVVTRLGLTFSPVVSLVAGGLLILWIMGWEGMWLRLGRWGVSEDPHHKRRTSNIYAELPTKDGGYPLYLVAHYDTKSQSLNLYLRAILFLFGNLGTALFVVWVWFAELRHWGEGQVLSPPAWVQAIFVFVCLLHLVYLFGRMRNGSEGAVDNASGVGVLLEAARILSLNPPRGIRPVFLFTGAEELGLLGAMMAAKKHGLGMLQSGAFIINIDSVGGGRVLRGCSMGKEGRHWLGELIKMSRKRGLELRRLPFLRGIMMDHLAFAPTVPAVSLTSIYGEGWHIHTARDTLALVRPEGLEAMGRLLLAIVESFESKRS